MRKTLEEGRGELQVGEGEEEGRGLMGRRRLFSQVGERRRGGGVGLTPPSGSSCNFKFGIEIEGRELKGS